MVALDSTVWRLLAPQLGTKELDAVAAALAAACERLVQLRRFAVALRAIPPHPGPGVERTFEWGRYGNAVQQQRPPLYDDRASDRDTPGPGERPGDGGGQREAWAAAHRGRRPADVGPQLYGFRVLEAARSRRSGGYLRHRPGPGQAAVPTARPTDRPRQAHDMAPSGSPRPTAIGGAVATDRPAPPASSLQARALPAPSPLARIVLILSTRSSRWRRQPARGGGRVLCSLIRS